MRPNSRLPRSRIGVLLALCVFSSASSPSPLPTPAKPQAPNALAARWQALLERDGRLLTDTTAAQLDALLPPLFARYHEGISEFADWAFGWRTSYALLRSSAVTLAGLPWQEPPRAQRLGAAWNDVISAKFDELVLNPAGGLPAQRRLYNRWMEQLQLLLDTVTADTLRTAALLRGREIPRQTWRHATTPEATAAALGKAPEAARHPVKIRIARPLLTRFTLRAPIAAAVTTAGENIGALGGFGDLGWLGNAGNLVPTVAAFLGIDYVLNRIDAAAHQKALEQELHRSLELEYAALRHTWLTVAQHRIDQRLAALRVLFEQDPRARGGITPISAADGMPPSAPRQ
jgi:hypothetical protein